MGMNRRNDKTIVRSRRFQSFNMLNSEHQCIHDNLLLAYQESKVKLKSKETTHSDHMEIIGKLCDFQRMIEKFYSIIHR